MQIRAHALQVPLRGQGTENCFKSGESFAHVAIMAPATPVFNRWIYDLEVRLIGWNCPQMATHERFFPFFHSASALMEWVLVKPHTSHVTK